MFSNSQFEVLLSRYKNQKLAHAYLFETNDYKQCVEDLKLFLKAINCPETFSLNCENCSLCTLFQSNNLPSFVQIEPDGIFIKKEQILDMMSQFSTVPIYSKYNMYIINQAEKLNSSSANTILKFLEEPNDNILGFFITSNKENVIPTITSRCQIISCIYESSKGGTDISYKEQVILYLNSIYKNKYDLLYNKQEMSNLYEERKDWQNFFETMIYCGKDFLDGNDVPITFFNTCDKSKVLSMIFLIEELLKQLQANGNVDLILDRFVIEMRCLYE